MDREQLIAEAEYWANQLRIQFDRNMFINASIEQIQAQGDQYKRNYNQIQRENAGGLEGAG